MLRAGVASALTAAALLLAAAPASAEPLSCSLAGYHAQPGLTASVANGALVLQWSGDRGQELRARFVLKQGTPTLEELAVRKAGGTWGVVASDVVADYRVATGLRRMSNQQMAPLRGLGVDLTSDIVDTFLLHEVGPLEQRVLQRAVEGAECNARERHHKAGAVGRDRARGDGVARGRADDFAGVPRQVVATTSTPWVAYKYHAGLTGMTTAGARVVWRDIANTWQDYRFGGATNDDEVPLKAANRLVVAERGRAGSIAVFPPPHTFFWAREIAINLGYNFYRKDSDRTFSFGIRQAEHEDESENQANFALYSARPGTEQRMTVFLYPSADGGEATFERALTFTHGDRYKPLPGYQVMNHHYHMDLGRRLGDAGSLDADIPDLVALKALGINIVSQVDSVGLGVENPPVGAQYPGKPPAQPRSAPAAPAASAARPRVDELQIRFNSIEGAKRHSDTNFLVLPAQEYYGSPFGGHTDLLFSKAVYWDTERAAGQPFTSAHPTFGTVYHLAGADDLLEMVRRENVLVSMPHPRTKGSTGFPDSIRHLPYFNDPHFHGVGFRWGMGLDRSEQRLCEYRCLTLLDDMSNWLAGTDTPLKQALSISEVRHMQPGDDIYASAPVSYVKLPALPSPDDVTPLISTLMKGDYFVTSGEVLVPNVVVKGSGAARTVEADIEWTFPLAIVEVVWGDGVTTGRQTLPVSSLPPSGAQHVSIPFDATGRKWVRFAVWDVAGNGALTQPQRVAP